MDGHFLVKDIQSFAIILQPNPAWTPLLMFEVVH